MLQAWLAGPSRAGSSTGTSARATRPAAVTMDCEEGIAMTTQAEGRRRSPQADDSSMRRDSCSSVASGGFGCEQRDYVGKGGHRQWFEHAVAQTSARVLDPSGPDTAVALG
jgi:hypothetical protein